MRKKNSRHCDTIGKKKQARFQAVSYDGAVGVPIRMIQISQ